MKESIFKSYLEHAGFIAIRINSKKAPVDSNWNTNPPDLKYDPNQLYGMMPPPNVLVVDIDVKNGKQGLESWEQFLSDNYPPDIIESEFKISPNVKTPSGGSHYYLSIEGLNHHDIPKVHPSYPGIDFITHGKSQVVAGNQTLENGEYIFEHLLLFPTLSSLNCFTRPNILPTQRKCVTIDSKYQKTGILNITAPQISKILTYISPEDYETWYKVAFMLLGSGLPEIEAKTLFHDWSAGSEKYWEGDCEKKWEELKAAYGKPGVDPLTIASLPFLAKEQNPSKIDEINEIYRPTKHLMGRFLLIESRKKSATPYYDLGNMHFVSSNFVQREMQPILKEVKEKLKTKKEPTLSKLEIMGAIRIISTDVYAPNKPTPVFTNEGSEIEYLNTYDPTSTPDPLPFETPLEGDLKFYIEHIQLIFGEYANDFLDYVAYLAQNPGKKIRYMLVLQGGVGTGKGLIMQAIRTHVLGEKNCRVIDTTTLLDDYNALLFDKQLIQIEELKVPSRDSHTLMNKIKTIITEPVAVRKEKFTASAPLPCIASFIALTNYKDCLKNADKRRYHAIISPIQDRKVIETKSGLTTKEYFNKLASIASAKNPNGGQLRAFFLSYNISQNFSPDERPEKSDYDKIEKENLDNNEKWGDYIDLVKYAYQTETLPDYIDCEYLKNESNKTNPDTGVPFFTADDPLTPKALRKFGRAYGYKIFYRCLFSDKLNETEARLFIKESKSNGKLIRKVNENLLTSS